MTPQQHAKKMARRIKATKQNVKKSEAASLEVAQKEAVTLSSGTLTIQDLRRLGFPYARRDPQTPLPPYIVNSHNDDYKDGWKTEGPAAVNGNLHSRLLNESKFAEFVFGTKNMISRDQRPQILLVVRRTRKKRIVAAVSDALQA